MATITPLPNGYHIEDVNWMTGHVMVFLANYSQGEFYTKFPRVDAVPPNSIRTTLCRGTESYVIPVAQVQTAWKTIPPGTFANRLVEYKVTDAGGFRTLSIRVARTTSTNGLNETWQLKFRVMVPMNGITDVDMTEQANRADIVQIDILQ